MAGAPLRIKKAEIRAVVKRADGTVEDRGVVCRIDNRTKFEKLADAVTGIVARVRKTIVK